MNSVETVKDNADFYLENNGKSVSRQLVDASQNNILTFNCYGVKIGVIVNRIELLQSIRDLLPVDAREVALNEVDHLFSIVAFGDGNPENALFCNGREWIKDPNLESLFSILQAQMRQKVAEFTNEKVFIHAGVVVYKNCLIMLPGNSFAGKTTLTAALVQAGAVYYSDEFAIVDRNGIVSPYPKPLSMRKRGSRESLQVEIGVEHFGGKQGVEPLPVKLVVITKHQPRARWRPEVLSAGQAILELLKHANNSLRHPQIVLPVLQKIAENARVIRSPRGAAEICAAAILREIDGLQN